MLSIKSYNEVNYEDYDEVWMIVRSWKSPDSHMHHIPELAPSLDLLNRFIALRNNNKWNYEKIITEYVPQFVYEFNANASVTYPLMNELINKSNTGKYICLACFVLMRHYAIEALSRDFCKTKEYLFRLKREMITGVSYSRLRNLINKWRNEYHGNA